jgi:hypothetical protein
MVQVILCTSMVNESSIGSIILIRVYELRHTYKSLACQCLSGGFSLNQVQEFQDFYIHKPFLNKSNKTYKTYKTYSSMISGT